MMERERGRNMAGSPFRQREDSCCHNCPDHRPVTDGPDGKPVTCRQGCSRWEAHEAIKAEREAAGRLRIAGSYTSRSYEQMQRRNLRDGRIR